VTVSSWDRLRLGALGAGGVALTHCVAYYLAIPDGHHRAEVLQSSGHGYWPLLMTIAIGLGVTALASNVVGPDRGVRSVSFARLATLQGGAWIVLETTERLVSGHEISGLLGEPVVWIGLALQIVAAGIGAALVRAVALLAGTLRGRRPRTDHDVPAFAFSSVRAAHPRGLRPGVSGRTLRGPPLVAVVH
jgi:hypothetical protein